MRIRKRIKRAFINFLLLVFAFVVQTSIFPLIPLFSSSPNLLIILVFSFGFIYGSSSGMLCGIFAGLLQDLFYSVPFGFFLFVFIVTGYFNGLFSEHYYDDYILLPLVLCTLSELFYHFCIMIYQYLRMGNFDLLYSLRYIMLPETVFTLLITFVVYRLFLLGNRHLDTVDEIRGQNIA